MSIQNLNRGTWGVDPITGKPWGFLRNIPLSDRRMFVTGETKRTYFNKGVDTQLPSGYVLTNADTNMPTDNVPSNEKWYLFGVAVGLVPIVTTNLFTPVTPQVDNTFRAMLCNSYIKMSVSEQEWFRFPCSLFLPAIRYGVQAASDAPQTSPWNVTFGKIEFRDDVSGGDNPYNGFAPYVLEANTNFKLEHEIVRDAAATLTALANYRLEFTFDRVVVGLSAS